MSNHGNNADAPESQLVEGSGGNIELIMPAPKTNESDEKSCPNPIGV